jgi:hypothetical protein
MPYTHKGNATLHYNNQQPQLYQLRSPAWFLHPEERTDKGIKVLMLYSGALGQLAGLLAIGLVISKVWCLELNGKLRAHTEHFANVLVKAYPTHISAMSFRGALSWANDIEHDAANATGDYLYRKLGRVDMVICTSPYQGASPRGPQRGMGHVGIRTGVHSVITILSYAEKLTQCKDGWGNTELGAQFAFLNEMVPMRQINKEPMHPSVELYYRILEHAFGPPLYSNAADLGALAHRGTWLWTNMFTQEDWRYWDVACATPAQETLGECLLRVTRKDGYLSNVKD